jgi:(1->4)-alpha-D-glucan 1-alpha-D-glucosylmutase
MARTPIATYRLQLHSGFTFEQAASIAGYLAALGVSHIYASPYLQAAPGSMHGYDIVDHGRVSEELGGTGGHARLCRALKEHGLGQILDIVPNHMAIGGPENSWWWDVLENGPSSAYASYFDVEWGQMKERERNQILLPILADHYGRELEAGKIRLERRGGSFLFRYGQNLVPVAPRSLAELLSRAACRAGSSELAFLADALEHLPLPSVTDREIAVRRRRNIEVIRDHLGKLLGSDPAAAVAADAVIRELDGDVEALDELLEKQNYRLAFWRLAGSDLGYRRFFDINSLVALRIEDEAVFQDTHRLVLSWIEEGLLDGLRIDHADGLWDPERYLKRLRRSAPDSWIVVEKILQPGERLHDSWPVQGTTGYDFLNLVLGLFIDPRSEKALSDFYALFAGEGRPYAAVLAEKKDLVLRELFGSDLNRLTNLMMAICQRRRRHRDYMREEVQQALARIITAFPVYRTYVRADAPLEEQDKGLIRQAVEIARQAQPVIDPELYSFIEGLLLLQYPGALETELVLRAQQLTAPIMAKGSEDTAGYCYNRLAALNEVGSDPGSFGVSIAQFHRRMKESASLLPRSMLATSTHDTKRSEDVRARLAVITEVPELWIEAVERWAARNERHRRKDLPDRNTEYLLYQTMVGAWPIEESRTQDYMRKVAREAKTHTSWKRPSDEYEGILREFIEGLYQDPDFLRDLESFAGQLIYEGRLNSLAQTLIKLTAPGVPDIYQGCEVWSLSLVDPDNRGPVDFRLRRRFLKSLERLDCAQIMQRMEEGLPKLWVIRQALKLRRGIPEAFTALGGYRPLQPRGRHRSHVIGFLRGERVATVVPRFLLSLTGGWRNTCIKLPEGVWRNELSGEAVAGGTVRVQELFTAFPVALLSRQKH